jgi:DNA-directed RNA polymerase subunit RPC12/RpoP
VPIQYRHLARQAVQKSSRLLETNGQDELIYACLELRKCVEALAYDLLTSYLKEVPLKALATWQPDKVMKELLRIDPRADKGSHIRMQREATDTEPAGEWNYLGEDRRLDAQRLGKMYQQLGNFLHVPTIKQTEQIDAPDFDLIRERVSQIKGELEHVLAARIWNVNFANWITFECSECSSPIRRRDNALGPSKTVECGNCGQGFFIEEQPDSQTFRAIIVAFEWTCRKCGAPRQLAESKAREGLDVSCPQCNNRVKLTYRQYWETVAIDEE